jgi:WD40 repeat protein
VIVVRACALVLVAALVPVGARASEALLPLGESVAQQAPPVDVTPPHIAGVLHSGRRVRAVTGKWSGQPGSFEYRWRRCGPAGCRQITGATAAVYTLREADVGRALQVSVVAVNRAGRSTPALSAATANVAGTHGPRPVNLTAPALGGNAVPGQQLSASNGTWGGAPLSFEYEWQRCDALGAACTSVAGANSATYTVAQADTGSTLRVAVIADNVAGESEPAVSAASALVNASAPPENIAPPVLSGAAQAGKQLSASPGSWAGAPAAFAYRWKRCNAHAIKCRGIASAKRATYTITSADIGKTLRVTVIASNSVGHSAPVTSAPSAVVTEPAGAPPANLTLPTIAGSTLVGDTLSANPGTWTNSPTRFAYQWLRCGSGGAKCAAISGAGGATYRLGEGDLGKTLRVSVIAIGAGGESAPALSAQTAVITAPAGEVPVNATAPQLSGAAHAGQLLSASQGTWSGNPTSFSYEWERCSARGTSCAPIAGAGGASYRLGALDVGATVRVSVTAANAAGASAPARSAPSEVVTATGAVSHYEYVLTDSGVSVYDIDNAFRLVESFTLPGTSRGIRGVMVSPVTHMLFVAYGGDGGGNGNGSVLAYDLLSKRVAWSVDLSSGIDSGAVSSDGSLLYIPDGENSSNGVWNILSAVNGQLLGKIETHGAGPHDGVMSADGRIMLLGDRNYNYLSVYNVLTGKIQEEIGPLVGGVRPNTINGSDSIAFTTATGFDGFQVERITPPGAVLYTESFGSCSGPFSTCSHGVALSPDSRQAYVIDSVRKAVQVWDVHGVGEGVAPVHIATVPVAGLQGEQEDCAYDCGRDGWVQTSLDGRYVFVGDAGDVIETATQKVVATMPGLINTRMFVEIDWAAGLPVASSGRQGIGYP